MKINELFNIKEEKREDIIVLLINNMERLSHGLEYEEAQYVLEKIKEELVKPDDNKILRLCNIQTIKDVYDLVTSNTIRLSMENYEFVDFLNLLVSILNRKDEIQGCRYIDIDRQRKVVAEEMVCLKMIIPSKWKGIKPNRRFLDILYEVDKDICKAELLRREKVKLWKVIKSGKDIEKIKKEVGKYVKRE